MHGHPAHESDLRDRQNAVVCCHAGGRKEGRTFLGLGWGSADEKKMRKSFGFGRDDFARFIDLQARLLRAEVSHDCVFRCVCHWTAVHPLILEAGSPMWTPILQDVLAELGYPNNEVIPNVCCHIRNIAALLLPISNQSSTSLEARLTQPTPLYAAGQHP